MSLKRQAKGERIRLIGGERLSLVAGALLAASESSGFAGESRAAIYRWSQSLLRHHHCWALLRRGKGLIRAYMERTTTAWSRPKTPPLRAGTSASAISRLTMRRVSTSSPRSLET